MYSHSISSSLCCGSTKPLTLPRQFEKHQSRSLRHTGRHGSQSRAVMARSNGRGRLQVTAFDNPLAGVWKLFTSIFTPTEEEEVDVAKSAEEYSKVMQEKMGSKLFYNHEDGINYNRITRKIIVGSCLQGADDVNAIRDKEGVTTVLCLQEDKDMAWWQLDIKPIEQRAKEVAGIDHIREPIRDFDPYDLRMKLPTVVRHLHNEIEEKGGPAYVHCTAGMGRAPGVALAHMWWCEEEEDQEGRPVGRPYSLDSAYRALYGKRPCHPQLKSIRAATCDILAGGVQLQPVMLTIKLDPSVYAPASTKVEISGLNVGWGNRLPLDYNPATGVWEINSKLPIGKFVYKFVINDEEWVHSEDSPTVQDGGNLNNVIEVEPQTSESDIYKTLMEDGADLTDEQRAVIRRWLETPSMVLK